MTVSTSYTPLTYTGNGSTTNFSVTWPFFDGTLVVTEIVIATGVETVKTINTHYTVTGGTDDDGLPATGTVVANSAPASTVQWRIERTTPKTQASTWGENDAFPQKTIEAALDKQILIAQEGTELDGYMQLVTSGDPDYWDAESYIIRNVADPTASTDAVNKSYGDANYGGTAATNASASASAAASSASAASTSATSASTSATQAINAAGFLYTFDSSTTMADPGSGDVRLNNSTFASVTAIAVADNSANTGNPDVSVSILAMDDSTSTANRGTVTLRKATAPENFAQYYISGASTDNTGWTQLAVTHLVSSGTFVGGDTLVLSFARTGDKGENGSGSGDMLAANNLSDLINKATSRTNLGVAIGTDVQAYDADLAAIAALNSTGLLARTAANAWAQRTLQAPAAGITITNPAGVAGDPTLVLANDLAAYEGLAATGIVARTADGAAAARTITGTASQITVTNGDGVSGNPTLSLDSGIYRSGGTDVAVADGGTGVSSLTAYAVVCGGTTSTGAVQSIAGVGSSGQVLTSNGAGALPTFQSIVAGANVDLLATISTTSGATQSVTGLSQSEMFLISLSGVSHGAGSTNILRIALSSNNGSSYGTARDISISGNDGISHSGMVNVLGTGATQNKVISPVILPSSGSLFVTPSVESTVTGVINAIQFSWDVGASFDAGTIYVYGLS